MCSSISVCCHEWTFCVPVCWVLGWHPGPVEVAPSSSVARALSLIQKELLLPTGPHAPILAVYAAPSGDRLDHHRRCRMKRFFDEDRWYLHFETRVACDNAWNRQHWWALIPKHLRWLWRALFYCKMFYLGKCP